MARQIKDNADYFTHDTDMRDDPKIKALRRKYKAEGYGIWCMLLELITDSDNFRLPIEYEIIAGDMDVEPELLISILHYCVQIGLLQTDEGCKTIWSKTLDKRFEPLLSKRERDRGRLSLAKIPDNIVIASESTQSRVEKSRAKKSTVEPFNSNDFFESIEKAFEEIRDNQKFIEEECIRTLSGRGWTAVDPLDIIGLLKYFMSSKFDIQKPKKEARQHFKNWLGAGTTKLPDLITRAEIFKKSLQ